jgi:hypothetical protein
MRPTITQSSQGDRVVQVGYAADGATIVITYINGATRAVPLQRATVPAAPDAKSPARLMRARSGVVPFAARKGLRQELIEWLQSDTLFAGAVIGGSGGTGKTRLAVELCDWAEEAEWLSGILVPIKDLGSLEALAEAETPRLIAVDYAESRATQLNELLSLLASRATQEAPVRVLLLVRAGPKHTTDWTESLRNQSDLLDNLLDRCEMHVLEELPLGEEERAELFEAAAGAFAQRNGMTAPPVPTALLRSQTFKKSPLLIVLAAYLAVHGEGAPPSTREELLRAILLHEERYWRSSSKDLFKDEVQRRWVIALSTLVSAESEAEAIERLRLLPDFSKASPGDLGPIARWAADQYPGAGWWNPLEPDLVGEQLIADEFSNQPAVLAGALAGERPQQLIKPLEVFGRAFGNHPKLAAAVQPVLSSELGRLCEMAVAQTRGEGNRDLIDGKAVALAVVLDKAIGFIEIDADAIASAYHAMPDRSNLVLDPLALTLSLQLVKHQRPIAQADLATESDFASALNTLSVQLGYAGRRAEGLAAIEECIGIFRRLAKENPAAYEPNLAMALNTLSNRLGGVGRHAEGLAAIEECVEIRHRLAKENPAAYEPDLAKAFGNLSNRLGDAGRHADGLAACEECIGIFRRLAKENPAAYEPDLATALNNLSADLADAGRHAAGLAASRECIGIRRRLASENPATYEPDLAKALNNLSNRLGGAGRHAEGLAASRECIGIFRRLAKENPAAYEPNLAIALNALSNRLGGVGRRAEGLAAIEECIGIFRRLAKENPAAYEPNLAMALNALSILFDKIGRSEDSERAQGEAANLRKHADH